METDRSTWPAALAVLVAIGTPLASQVIQPGDLHLHARFIQADFAGMEGHLGVGQQEPAAVEWWRTDDPSAATLDSASVLLPFDRLVDLAPSDTPRRFLALGWHLASASGRSCRIRNRFMPPS